MIVCMSTYNRAEVTRECLSQLAKTKGLGVTIQVWDAGSDEYTPEDLISWGADKAFRASGRVNDGQNRTAQFVNFLNNETDELLYCVDNDAFHDPNWVKRLYELYDTHACIINLFNSKDHDTCTRAPMYKIPYGRNNIATTKDVVFRYTCGGISFMISRELLRKRFTKETYPHGLSTSYDWIVPRWDRHVCTSRESYVAHMDTGGMHTHMHGKPAIDLGLNPTDWLKYCWLEGRGDEI